MRRLLLPTILVGLGLTGARADIPPPPGYMERAAASLIGKAGHACPSVTKLEAPVQPQGAALAAKGLNPQTAVCDNGRRFLIGWPPRRRGPPVANALPPPDPVVQPLP